jgi:hypothetical protein
LRPVDVQRRRKRADRVEGDDDSEPEDRVFSRARALGRGTRTVTHLRFLSNLTAHTSPPCFLHSQALRPTLSLSPSANRGSAKVLKGVDACARYSELWRPCPRPGVDGSPMPMPTLMLRLWRRILYKKRRWWPAIPSEAPSGVTRTGGANVYAAKLAAAGGQSPSVDAKGSTTFAQNYWKNRMNY